MASYSVGIGRKAAMFLSTVFQMPQRRSLLIRVYTSKVKLPEKDVATIKPSSKMPKLDILKISICVESERFTVETEQ